MQMFWKKISLMMFLNTVSLCLSIYYVYKQTKFRVAKRKTHFEKPTGFYWGFRVLTIYEPVNLYVHYTIQSALFQLSYILDEQFQSYNTVTLRIKIWSRVYETLNQFGRWLNKFVMRRFFYLYLFNLNLLQSVRSKNFSQTQNLPLLFKNQQKKVLNLKFHQFIE